MCVLIGTIGVGAILNNQMSEMVCKPKRKRTIAEIKPLLAKVKTQLVAHYGDKVDAIFLYGSFVKGIADEDSDIDIALILKGNVDKSKEIDRIYDFLYELELESCEVISVKPSSKEEIENSNWPLYVHILREGYAL